MDVRPAVRALPPIARRDARIAELKERLRQAQRQRDQARALAAANQDSVATDVPATPPVASLDASDQPSWKFKFAEAQRRRPLLKECGQTDPIWTINSKAAGYEFARSHGLDIPKILATFDRVEDVPWNDLPSGVVLKTDQGTASRGVMPLHREGIHVVDLLDVRRGQMTIDDVVAYFRDMRENRKASTNGVVEELLRSPYEDGRAIALDLKLYCFYGVVGMIMIRDVNGSRRPPDFRMRYIDAEGTDLGNARPGQAADESLPGPLDLAGVVDAGERLSGAIPTPFVRIDLYERSDSIVFGEISPFPGGDQNLSSAVDRNLGQLWEEAEARLRAEAIASGIAAIRPGHATTMDTGEPESR